MQDREERARLLLVAGRDRTPLLQPVPHPLNTLPVHIDPVWAVDGSLIAPCRDGRSGAQFPYRRAQRVRRVAAICHNPAWDGGQKVEQIEALWRLAGLPGGEGEAQGPTLRVRKCVGLGAETALASAQRLAGVPPFTAPAAFWCARMMVPSMKTRPSSGQLAAMARSKRRSQTPSLDQRRKVCAAIHHGPSSAGMAAPLGAVLHAPEDGFDSPAQVGQLAACLRSHGLDQRLNRTPLGIGEDRHGIAPAYLDGEMPRGSTTRKPALDPAAAEP